MPKKQSISRDRKRRESNRTVPQLLDVLESRQLLSGSSLASLSKFFAHPTFVVLGKSNPGSDLAGAGSANPTTSGEISPSEMRTAYGVNLISFGSVAGTGAGQTIALIDAYNDPDIISDAATFNTTFGLQLFNAGGPTLQVLNENGGTSLPGNASPGSWDLEESLDVEWAHVIAPQANIILYEANSNSFEDLLTAAQTAAAKPGVSVVSMSFGGGEFSTETAFDSVFTTPSGHQGVTFLASTGDSGAPADYPAYSPNVVAVGGTSLTIDSNGDYVSESAWSDGGGGISQVEAQPSYQVGHVNGLSTTNRTAPDVSIDADPNTGVPVLDSDAGGWYQVGGTSLASPMWGGLIAIADQGLALQGNPSLNGVTQTLPLLYSLPQSDFHDVTTGNNGYPAGPGYDLATGRGTPIANLLVPALVSGSPSVTGPSNATVAAGNTLVFSTADNDAITVSDSEGSGNAQLTLTVDDGTLATAAGSGVSVTGGANNSPSMTLEGTPAQINAALNGLAYTPDGGFSGSDSLSLSLTASDGGGSTTASATVNITVNPSDTPPTITSGNSATFTVGSLGGMTVKASGFPTATFGETGALPAGVTFNTATGVLSGTPQAGSGGTYDLQFTANNGVGSPATQNFTLTVDQASSITSANNTTFTVGTAGSFSMSARGFPAPTFGEIGGLPSGVTFNSATGSLTGTPLGGTVGPYDIMLTASNGIGPQATQSFTLQVVPAGAAVLAFEQSPTSGTAGTALSPVIKVAVEDQYGDVVTSDNSAVELTLDNGLFVGGATTASVQAVNGVATFTGLSIATAGSHVLTASDGSLADANSGSINVKPGTGKQLAFLQTPSTAIAGQAFSPAVEVAIEDQFGNVLTTNNTSKVALDVHSGPHAAVGGKLVATASDGVATFSNFVVDIAGSYTLGTISGSLSAVSGSISVAAGQPEKLVILKKPTTGIAGQTLSPSVEVAVEDQFANLVSGNPLVTIGVSSGPAGFDPSSITQVAASGGVANFTSVLLDIAGKYTLSASDGSITSAATSSITISAGAATHLSLLQSPGAGTAGLSLGPFLKVAERDAYGNIVAHSPSQVTISVANGPEGIPAGNPTHTTSAGIAAFSNLVLDIAGTYTLAASDGSLTGVVTGSITINPAAAKKLFFTLVPVNGIPSQQLFPAVEVSAEDRYGNVNPSYSSMVNVAVESGPSGFASGSTTSTSAVEGVATFSNLMLNTTGTYTLKATSGTMAAALSSSFTVGEGSEVSTPDRRGSGTSPQATPDKSNPPSPRPTHESSFSIHSVAPTASASESAYAVDFSSDTETADSNFGALDLYFADEFLK